MFESAIASIATSAVVCFVSLKTLNILYFSRAAERIPEGAFGLAFLLPAAFALVAGFWLPRLLFKKEISHPSTRIVSAVVGCVFVYWFLLTTTPP